jgi:hypothetical protein
MIVLSSLEYGCNVYGAAQLKRLEPINNQGLRIAIGAFCINKTENLLCEAGMLDFNHRRMIKTATTAVRISSMPEHPMRTTLTDTEKYAVRPKLTKPYPIRALDGCPSLNIDPQKVNVLTLKGKSPWMVDPEKQILTSLRWPSKGAEKERIRVAAIYRR